MNNPNGLAFNSVGHLFVASDGSIYDYSPSGVRSTFASGLFEPTGLAFDTAGNLFETDNEGGHIYKFTPNGGSSTFASGLNKPFGLAFDSAGNLFTAEIGGGHIYKFTPSGARSTFASGLGQLTYLTFQIPEPSTSSMLVLGSVALLYGLRRRGRSSAMRPAELVDVPVLLTYFFRDDDKQTDRPRSSHWPRSPQSRRS